MQMAMDFLQTTMPAGGLLAHTVYHGSPHKFNKFDMSKIGTGEGAQAYGHGLYFAEAPDVAKSYAEKLGPRSYKGKEVSAYDYSGRVDFADGSTMQIPDSEWASFQNELASSKAPGAMYKVDIPDEAIPRMLDWESPANKQPEAVQEMLKYWNGGELPSSLNSGDSILRYLQSNLKGIGKGHQKAEDLLKEAGVPGIKYLDGVSRTAGEGSRNFVLFQDDLPRILEVNGTPTGLNPWQQGEYKGLLR
jgi:hypothetical protein